MHRLIATIGLLLYFSAHLATIQPLTEALEAAALCERKATGLQDAQAKAVAKEVQTL